MRTLQIVRWFVPLVTIALVAGACTGGDSLDEIHECSEIGLVDRSYLFVPVEDPEAGADPGAAEPDEVQRTAAVLLATPTDDIERYGDLFDLEAFSVLDAIGFYYVVDDSDPTVTALDAINELRAAGIDARPVYGMTLQGHWTMEPGGEPASEVPDFTGGTTGSGEVKTVGIVDSGFLVPGVEDASGQELFPSNVSTTPGYEFHGSFVQSIIERIAPGSVLHVGEPLFVQSADWESDLQTVPPVTDTRAVGVAIVAAVGGNLSNPGVEVLNMSLGTYACPAPGAPFDVAPPGEIERVLNKLTDRGVEVFAAGGNEAQVPGTTAFFPAGYPNVTGVGAIDSDGDPVTWSHYGRDGRSYTQGVSWDATELGVDVIGLTRPSGGAISWSGSSFATAVASGRAAAMAPGTGSIGICWAEGLDQPNAAMTALGCD